MQFKSKLIVGSADDCDIVVTQTTVSKRHCQLSWQDGQWEICDLNSTNGTFVDGDRVTTPRRLHPTSKVTLGRSIPLPIPAAPDIPTAPLPAPPSVKPVAVPVSNQRHSALLFTLTGAIAVLAVICLGLLLASKKPEKAISQTLDSSSPAQDVGSSASNANVATSSGNISSTSAVSNGESATPYWAIVVSDAATSSQRLIGTAVAVGPHRLLTLASIVDAIDQVKDEYPVVSLIHSDLKIQLRPTAITLHPDYAAARGKLQDFESDLTNKLNSLTTLSEPTLEDRLEWSSRLETIMSELSNVDLASVECAEKMPVFSSLDTANTLRSSSDSLSLVGYPMILPNPVIKDNLIHYFLKGQAKSVYPRDKGNESHFVESGSLPGVSLISMVCTNEKSQIVGIVVRQPPLAETNAPQQCQLVAVEEFWK